jgi:DNA repair protein RecN (Recombination protein N)
MLQKLIIKNYALIRELHIEPTSKFNTITGETGAGKSIMLGAVGLLLGKRADTKVLYEAEKKCIVEGQFDISNYALKVFFDQHDLDYEDACIIRREISSSGKSRAFINDTPTTLDVLKELGAFLMDVHSQHQTLLLGEQDFQLKLIDAYTRSSETFNEYQQYFITFSKAKKALQQIETNYNKVKAEKDYNQFLFDELEKAQLKDGEQDQLEQQLKMLENGEMIQQKLVEASNLLEVSEYAVLSTLHEAVEALRSLQNFNETYQELFTRLNSVFIEAQDISRTVELENNNFEHEPLALQQVQDRLSLIYQLQQKHQVESLEALLTIKEQLEAKLVAVENADAVLAEHKSSVAAYQKR